MTPIVKKQETLVALDSLTRGQLSDVAIRLRVRNTHRMGTAQLIAALKSAGCHWVLDTESLYPIDSSFKPIR